MYYYDKINVNISIVNNTIDIFKINFILFSASWSDVWICAFLFFVFVLIKQTDFNH